MIDFPRTLAPSSGLITDASLLSPDSSRPLWSLGAQLAPIDGLVDVPPSARICGAMGHTRRDTLVRGTGEAVERYALRPWPEPDGSLTGPAARIPAAVPVWEHALAAPAAQEETLTWVLGTRMTDGGGVMVPSALVDWPTAQDHGLLFDPSPSGAASGDSPHMALRSALMETVERDAFLVAWARGLRLPAWRGPGDITVPVTPADRAARAAAESVWRHAEAQSREVVVATVPTAVRGLWCVAAFMLGSQERRAVVGLKTSDRLWQAVAGALQETWQVWAALEQTADQLPPRHSASDVLPLITEEDRLRHMLGTHSYEVMRGWVESFTSASQAPEPAVSVGVEELVTGMSADGATPVVVDLSFRLPDPVRAMGWHALKVIPVGYQVLRMDERPDWSWHAKRVDSAVARLGLDAMYPGPSPDRPHPLP